MLATLRKSANSFVIKILMTILLFSFVLWGVGDMLRTGSGNSILKVADMKVNEVEFNNLYREQIAIIQQQFGHEFTKEELNDPQLKHLITNQIVNRLIHKKLAADMNFVVSDDMVKFEIAGMPMFAKDGKFDKDILEGYLRNMGVGEAKFVELLKEDLSSQNLGLLLAVLRFDSNLMVDTMLKSVGQTRVIKMITIPKNLAAYSAQPTDAELKEVFESNKSKFMIPERRDISYAVFGADSIPKEVVTDSMLMEIYKSKKQHFADPEKRKVQQLVFKDKAAAEAALADIKKGMKFDEVGKKNFPNKKTFVIGELTKQGLSGEIANAIFTLPVGVPSELVSSPLGYHIFIVDSITPEKSKEFAEVKERIKTTYMEERLYEKLNELAQKVDKEILAGKSFADIAVEFGFKTQDLAFVSKTDDKDMMKSAGFKTASFSTDEGTVSMVMPLEGQDSYFILAVNKVYPGAVKDLEKVKPEVIKIWQEDKAHAKVTDVSQDLYKVLSGGAKLDDTITKFELSAPRVVNLSMLSDSAKQVPFEFLKEAFAIKEGSYTHPFKDDKGDYIMGYISEIIDADLNQLKDKRAHIAAEIMQSAPNDMMSQILNKAKEKYKVEVNHKYIEGLEF